MSVIRVGSTGSYAEGWEQIFGGAGARGGKSGTKPARRKAKVAKASREKAAAPKAATSKAATKKAARKKPKAKARRR